VEYSQGRGVSEGREWVEWVWEMGVSD
jgi:hypothetical protein